jgi:peptide/nickel transport system substrate-binding protein
LPLAAGLASAPFAALGQGQPRRGGTLNIVLQPEPPMLMLPINQGTTTQVAGGKIFQSLLTFDFQLKPLPSLAKSWTVSPDGLTYTFKLQENVKWHDGKPFTSADVAFSTQVFLTEVHGRARANFGRVASVETPDAHTIIYKLKEPFGPFLHAFEVSSAPLVPKHIYEGTDFRKNPANDAPIGTGPFKFKEWKRGSNIELVRNENYWKPGLPYLDGISFRIIPDAALRAVALESGQAHASQFDAVEPFEVQRLAALPHLSMTTKGYEFVSPIMWIDINNRRGPLADKRVRQAILFALDREFILKNLFFGMGRVATGPIASTTRFYDPNVPKYPFDPKKAEALLEEAGFKKGADGVRVKMRCIVLPYEGRRRRAREDALHRAALWRGLAAAGRVHAPGLQERRHRSDAREYRRRRLLEEVDRGRLRADLQLSLAVRRSRPRRVARLYLDQHPPRRALDQYRRLRQSEGRRAVRGRRQGRQGRGPAEGLFRGPEDPGRGRAGGLDPRNGLAELRQQEGP